MDADTCYHQMTRLLRSGKWKEIPPMLQLYELFPLNSPEEIVAAVNRLTLPKIAAPVKNEHAAQTPVKNTRGRPAHPLTKKVADFIIASSDDNIYFNHIVTHIFPDRPPGSDKAIRDALRKATHSSGILARRGITLRRITPYHMRRV